MPYIHPQTRIIAAIALGGCVAAMAVYVVGLMTISSMQQTLAETQQQLASVQATEQQTTRLARTLSATEATRAELRGYLIRDDEVVVFLSRLEQLGAAQGATVQTERLAVVPRDGLVEALDITITATGSYGAVTRVLDMLETLPYKSYVVGTAIQQSVGAGWEGTFDIIVFKQLDS